jgi:hypothetical protein
VKRLVPLSPVRPRSYRYLGLDIEAQHASTWGNQYDGRIFFGAALRFEDEPDGMSYLRPHADRDDFERWVKPLHEPNIIVVAHNGTYDLTGLSGESVRLGLGPLPAVLLSDTLKHGPKVGQMFGRSLGNLCQMYGLIDKGSMSRFDWDAAYRGEEWALEKVREYNINDVDCVLELRKAMVGILSPPKAWKP